MFLGSHVLVRTEGDNDIEATVLQYPVRDRGPDGTRFNNSLYVLVETEGGEVIVPSILDVWDLEGEIPEDEAALPCWEEDNIPESWSYHCEVPKSPNFDTRLASGFQLMTEAE